MKCIWNLWKLSSKGANPLDLALKIRVKAQTLIALIDHSQDHLLHGDIHQDP